MVTTKLNILFSAISYGLFLMTGLSHAAYFQLETSATSTTLESPAVVEIFLLPSEEKERVYTFKLVLDYSGANLVDFKFEKELVPLWDKDYNFVDDKHGKLIKTAGKPGGIIQKTKIAKAVFLPKDNTDNIVLVPRKESMILDAANKDKFEYEKTAPLYIFVYPVDAVPTSYAQVTTTADMPVKQHTNQDGPKEDAIQKNTQNEKQSFVSVLSSFFNQVIHWIGKLFR